MLQTIKKTCKHNTHTHTHTLYGNFLSLAALVTGLTKSWRKSLQERHCCTVFSAVAVFVCVSVCVVSVTFVHCVKTNKHIFNFFSSLGRHTILVFLHQTVWQYLDGNLLYGGIECRWGRLNSRFSTNIWLCNQQLHLLPAFCLMRVCAMQVLDHQAQRAITHSVRLTKRGLALYTITVDRESCVWQQGLMLRWRQQNRIELYALLNPKPK